ncbi:MAG: alpha/beta hydrolase, partial [Christensenella sp.]
MKQEINVKIEHQNIALLSGITFAQTPYWFPYFNVKDLKMDILRPFGENNKKLPLIIWVCGGAWLTMDRAAHIPNLIYWAKRGYIVASIEYRMSNCAQFPAQLNDVKSAVRYLRANADTYEIDANRIAIMGESAGGYLAAMAGATSDDTSFDTGEHLDMSSSVSAVVDYYGPSDFTLFKQSGTTHALSCSPESLLLGYDADDKPEKAKYAGVLAHINRNTPPFMILHGKDDKIVSP